MNMNYVGLEKSSNKISLIDRGILSQGSMKSIKLPAICTHLDMMLIELFFQKYLGCNAEADPQDRIAHMSMFIMKNQ